MVNIVWWADQASSAYAQEIAIVETCSENRHYYKNNFQTFWLPEADNYEKRAAA
jgi:hypothetical protein